MKIRAIYLKNVRRFAGRKAELTDIGDGVSTITEPNETGKSTFFDALHAVLFYDHKTTAAEIRSLQPYSKGAVEIAADIELDSGRFRVAKTFLASRSATITNLDTNQIIAQEGEAEAWIEKSLGTDIAGPAGLLWVKQGVTGFGPAGTGQSEKRQRDEMRETRQTLMSTVAGHIDSVTGGRRMDTIMKKVSFDLDALATKNLGPKANGEWGKATARMDTLSTEQTTLQAQVTELSSALAERGDLKTKLADTRAATDDTDRATRMSELETEIEQANEHERKVEGAARNLRIAELELNALNDQITEIDARAERRLDFETKKAQAKMIFDQCAEDLVIEDKAHAQAKSAHDEATDAFKTSRAAHEADRIRTQRAADIRRRAEIASILKRAEGFQKTLKTARGALALNKVDNPAMQALDTLLREQAQDDAVKSAQASIFNITYSGPQELTVDGATISEGQDHPITNEMTLDIPTIGSMTLRPARANETPDKSPIADRIQNHLDALGAKSAADARTLHTAWLEQTRASETAQNSLDALVPDGLTALTEELSTLPENASDEAPLVDTPQILSLDAAETQEADARDAMDEARSRRDAANGRSLQAQTALTLTNDALEQDISTTPPRGTKDTLKTQAEQATKVVDTAKVDHEALLKTSIDLDSLNAEHDRLASARKNARTRRDEMQSRVSELDGMINARAGDGVEARLSEVNGELEKASARAARYAFEVKVMAQLRDELERSRTAARDAYFEPVKAELGPLLSMLHDNAHIEMDSETMLPARLKRGDIEDDIDVLSGGAAEQIAILTRLAFAKLYAKQGRSVPVILDDALVHSDDDRIVRMFTALTRISKDQQIIVFSCRSRAFEDLGGHRPQIKIEPASTGV